MSLASQVLRLDGQPEEEGHEQHHPSVDAKGGALDEEARRPTVYHEHADRNFDFLNQHEQEAGAKRDAKDLAKDVDMDVIGQPGAEAG